MLWCGSVFHKKPLVTRHTLAARHTCTCRQTLKNIASQHCRQWNCGKNNAETNFCSNRRETHGEWHTNLVRLWIEWLCGDNLHAHVFFLQWQHAGQTKQHAGTTKSGTLGTSWPSVRESTSSEPSRWPSTQETASRGTSHGDVRTPGFRESPRKSPEPTSTTWRPSRGSSVSRLSYLFAHLHLLSSDSFSSALLSSNLSLLSASALLCFSSVHIVGSLTSKLPSTTLLVLQHSLRVTPRPLHCSSSFSLQSSLSFSLVPLAILVTLPSRDNLSFALQLFSVVTTFPLVTTLLVLQHSSTLQLVYVTTSRLRCNSFFTFQRSFFVAAANFCYKSLLVAKPSFVFVNRFVSTRRLPFLLQHVPTLLFVRNAFCDWLAESAAMAGWLADWLNPPPPWLADWLIPPLWLAGWLTEIKIPDRDAPPMQWTTWFHPDLKDTKNVPSSGKKMLFADPRCGVTCPFFVPIKSPSFWICVRSFGK